MTNTFPIAQAMLERYKKAVEAELYKHLPASSGGYESVIQAMRYSLTGGGKRIRPALVMEFCRLAGEEPERALPFAAALEMVHTYSLIHDDLPCMDNDDMRRGKPSCHKAFGEDIALLAGDALLTLAFETVLSADFLPMDRVNAAAVVLARAAGVVGMIGGQALDLGNEGKQVSLDNLREMDQLKTGALIRAAAALGCIAGGASDKQKEAADAYTTAIGLAFQIVDDILDVTGDAAALGKAIGSDAANSKCTYVTLLGLNGAAAAVDELQTRAVDSLQVFGGEADALRELAAYLSARRS